MIGNFLIALLEIMTFVVLGRGSAAGKGGRIFTIVMTLVVLTLVVIAVAKNSSIQ